MDPMDVIALAYTTMVDLACGAWGSYHEVLPKVREVLYEPLVFNPDRVGEGELAEQGYEALLALAGGPAPARAPAPDARAQMPDTSQLPPGLRLA